MNVVNEQSDVVEIMRPCLYGDGHRSENNRLYLGGSLSHLDVKGSISFRLEITHPLQLSHKQPATHQTKYVA